MVDLTEMFSAEEISGRVKELAAEISRDYTNCEIILVCVLKGALFFVADLAREITVPVQIDCIKVSSYGENSESSGEIRLELAPSSNFSEKHVVIVEDIVDMGYTARWLRKYFSQFSPASVKLCALLDKPSRRKVSTAKIDYLGFTIPDEFVVGYGLDFAQNFRNLPYIAKKEVLF